MRKLTLRNIFSLILASTLIPIQGSAHPSDKPKSTQNSTKPSAVRDVLPIPFSGSADVVTDDGTALKDIKSIEGSNLLSWPPDSSSDLQKLIKARLDANSPCGMQAKNQVYIFHISHTTKIDSPSFTVLSSGWYAYRLTSKGLKFSGVSGSGDQLIYNKSKALIIGISEIGESQTAPGDTTNAAFQAQLLAEITNLYYEAYSISVVQGVPENSQALGQLLSGIAKVGGGAAVAGGPLDMIIKPIPPTEFSPLFVSVGCQAGTVKLPYTLTVTNTIATQETKPKKDDQKSNSGSQLGTVACSGTGLTSPCSTSRSFSSLDAEWWDVSIGITTPGTQQTKYAFSTTSNKVQTSVTRHTDLYVFVDLFPWALHHSKESIYPHFNLGVPITSQTLYRPYFGMSENLTGWTGIQRKLSLPVAVNFFAGVVWMKTDYLIGDPTTQAEFNTNLKPTRVWKGLFGIEVPVSSMLSKLGGKGGSAKGSGG
jgi:hypothetical protein